MSLPGPSSPLQGQSVASAFPLQEHATAPIAQGQPTAIQPGRSTLTPAEGEGAAVGGGCCTTLCNLIANVIAALCNFLSGLPLIGSWFATAPEAPAEAPPEAPPEAPEMTVPEMQARINAIYHIIGKEESGDALFDQPFQRLRPFIVQMLQDVLPTPHPEALLEGETRAMHARLLAVTRENPTLQPRYMREVCLPLWTQALELYTIQKGLAPTDVNTFCDTVARISALDQPTKNYRLGPNILNKMKREACEHLRQTILGELYHLQLDDLARSSSLEEFERSCLPGTTFSLAGKYMGLLPEELPMRTLFYQKVLFPISQEVLQRMPTWMPTWISIKRMEDELDQIEAFTFSRQRKKLSPEQNKLLNDSEDTAFPRVLGAVRTMAEQVGVTQEKDQTIRDFDIRVFQESQKNSVHLETYLRTVELPYWQTVQSLMAEALHPSSA